MSPENSRAGASAFEVALRHKLAIGESIDKVSCKNEKEKTFKDFSLEWFNTYVKNNNKAAEIKRKESALNRHLIPFFGKKEINKITGRDVENFKALKRNEGLSNKSTNNYLDVFSKCLASANEWFGLDNLPKMKKLKLPPLKNLFLSTEECKKLLENTEGIWREIILTAMTTGMRQGELKALDWPDVDLENKEITVRYSWCEYSQDKVAPKSNKERKIPITNELCWELIKRRQKTGIVFPDILGKRFDKQKLNTKIARGCKKAGLEVITCHILRHTYASHLALAGVSIQKIQALLGHANIQITMRYAHLTPSSLREAVNMLEPLVTPSLILRQPAGNAVKKSAVAFWGETAPFPNKLI